MANPADRSFRVRFGSRAKPIGAAGEAFLVPERNTLEQVRPITGRTGKGKEGEKVSEGFKVALNWGNSQGAKGPGCFVIPLALGRLIKTVGNLQDLRQKIYRKAKAQAVGWAGVAAGEKSGLKVWPIGYVS